MLTETLDFQETFCLSPLLRPVSNRSSQNTTLPGYKIRQGMVQYPAGK